jgi:hypothetical protein
MSADGFFGRIFGRNEGPSKTREPSLALAEKYGWSTVPAEVIYSAFDQIVAPGSFGFGSVKRGLAAVQVNDDIFHVIQFCAGKGSLYSIRWGVSLAYVPHEWSDKCKFHRTLKSVHFDLFENASDFLVKDPYSGEDRQYLVNTLHGETCLRGDLTRAWRLLQPVTQQWFASCAGLDGVLNQANKHVNHDWRSFRHHPDPKLVRAFTLARLGQLAEGAKALEELAAVADGKYKSVELQNALRQTARPKS